MDRGIWQATVNQVARFRHDLATIFSIISRMGAFMSRAERLSFDSWLFISIIGSRFQHWQRGLSRADGLMTCCQALVPCLVLVAPADMDTVWLHVAFPAGTVDGGCRGSHSPFPEVSCKHNSIQLVLEVRAGASSVSISSCFLSSTIDSFAPTSFVLKNISRFFYPSYSMKFSVFC